MNKQNALLGIILIIIIIALIIFSVTRSRSPADTSAVGTVSTSTQETGTPLGAAPDINPAGRVNPLKDVKTNPFE